MSKYAAATYAKAFDDFLVNVKGFLKNMGLIEQEGKDQLKMSEENRNECQKFLTARQALEDTLIASGEEKLLLTEERCCLLNLAPLQLLNKLREGSVSSVSVLEAFQAKAIEESKRTNCVTGFISEARQWAESLDALRTSKSNDVSLPLFGLPISVKETIMVEGTDATMGLHKNLDQPSDCDAAIICAFKKLGAVPFVKTNVPQLSMGLNCSNPVYGESTNPHDTNRSPGGSSGGECSLIGGGGSVLGIGTDIGGDSRAPAHFCGVVSIKPTARRLPSAGNLEATPGIVGVYDSISLIGRDADILSEATKVLLSSDLSQYDSNLPPVLWKENLFVGTIKRPLKSIKKVLRIGWYDDNGLFQATPGVKRAVSESVVALKNLGHELVPFQPPDVMEGLKLWYDFVMADNGTNCASLLKGETLDPSAYFYKTVSSVPPTFKNIAKPYIRYQIGDFNSELTSNIGTGADLWKKMSERSFYVSMFVKACKKEELDLIVCPAFPTPAPPKGFNSKIATCGVYSMIYNLLDFPCCVLPVTRETEEDQKLLTEEYPTKDCLHQLMKEYTTGCTGMPIGVQFVALPFCEEVLCRIMTEFSKAINYN